MTGSGRLEVGRIGRPHGLRGEVTVVLTTDRTERLLPGAVLYAGDRTVRVENARSHRAGWIVQLEGVHDREGAERLRGATLSAEPLQVDDAIWVHELVGAQVRDRQGRRLGQVSAVEANPASDLLVLDDGTLVPLTFLVEQSADGLVVDPPEGLLDLNRPDSRPDPAAPGGE